MSIGKKLIAGEFKQIGQNEIKTSVAVKLWDKRFHLTKYGDEFSLSVARKGTATRIFKSKITEGSAMAIISALRLHEVRHPIFAQASSFVEES